MLGIESEISVDGEIGDLSIMSQLNPNEKGNNGSTNKTSTLDGEEGTSGPAFSNVKMDKIRTLRARLQEIERHQEMFEDKMRNCVEKIEREVKKKEEQNRELQQLLKGFKEELIQSREDIEVLSDYLKKNGGNSRKLSPKNQDSQSNSNKPIAARDSQKMVMYNPKAADGKNFSPKNRMLLKPSSPNNQAANKSPKSRPGEYKKSSSPGIFGSSPFTRKAKLALK